MLGNVVSFKKENFVNHPSRNGTGTIPALCYPEERNQATPMNTSRQEERSRSLRVVLIQPAEPFGKDALIPQSLLELAAILQAAGIAVEIIDARLDNLSVLETIGLLTKADFDVVGITGLTNAYRYIKDFSFAYKREFPEKPLIAGGHFIMTIPEIVLGRVPIDVACTGEGDEIIVELVQRLVDQRPLDGIHNIAYLKDGVCVKTDFKLVSDLDSLPLPAYELLRMDKYLENCDDARGFHVTTGRGCVHHCYYCGSLYKKVRRLSPKKTLHVFDLLHDKYGVTAFTFSEENSFYPQHWLVDLCTLLRESGRDYHVQVAGCADHVTEEICRALASIKGKSSAAVAVEHWNPDIQKKFFRAHQSSNIERALQLFQKYDIPNRGISILWGHPDDTLESFKDTFRKSLETQRRYSINNLSIRALHVIPNSRYYADALRLGKIVDFEDFMYSTTGYAPFVNLTKYDDDVYRKFITQLWFKKEIFFSPRRARRLKFMAAYAMLNGILSLPPSARKPFRSILERFFMVPIYNPAINYYRTRACFAEILQLPPTSRIVVSTSPTRENLGKILNSVREAHLDLAGFFDSGAPLQAIHGFPLVSLESIPDLKPTHVVLFSDTSAIKRGAVQTICPQTHVITIDCRNSGGLHEVPGKGLHVWFTLEENKRF